MKHLLTVIALTFSCIAGAGEYINYSPYQVLFFKDPAAWSAAHNNAVFPEQANNFHFYTGGDARVEFETDGLLQFYIESGTGKDAWYGTQDGPNHRWSFGHDASDEFDFKFSGNSFGIDHSKTKFVIRQDATIYPGALGTVTKPAYAFDGDSNTGIYTPGSDNIALTAGGIEAVRFTSTSTQNMRLWGGTIGTGGKHVIAIPEGSAPVSTSAGQLYVDGGALWYKSPNGTITQIGAP